MRSGMHLNVNGKCLDYLCLWLGFALCVIILNGGLGRQAPVASRVKLLCYC